MKLILFSWRVSLKNQGKTYKGTILRTAHSPRRVNFARGNISPAVASNKKENDLKFIYFYN